MAKKEQKQKPLNLTFFCLQKKKTPYLNSQSKHKTIIQEIIKRYKEIETHPYLVDWKNENNSNAKTQMAKKIQNGIIHI